jgi:hypothetical protein
MAISTLDKFFAQIIAERIPGIVDNPISLASRQVAFKIFIWEAGSKPFIM